MKTHTTMECGHCSANMAPSINPGFLDCPNGCVQRVREAQAAGERLGSCGRRDCEFCINEHARQRLLTRHQLLGIARHLQESVCSEEPPSDIDVEEDLLLIAATLGMSRDELDVATGPWVHVDERCEACNVPEGRPAPLDCPSCAGSGLRTIGLGGPFG